MEIMQFNPKVNKLVNDVNIAGETVSLVDKMKALGI